MPRKARKKSKSGIYHIILRGINKQTIFEDHEDKKRFLDTLAKYKNISKYELYGYCLMDNHVHLLVKETEESISMSMKRISSSYVYWYNMKYDRCGHLFQERFKSENVENSTYFLTVLRYIHQNPLKAGLVKDTLQCKWTSTHEYIKRSKLIHTDVALALFSANRKDALNLFCQFMQEQNEDHCLEEDLVYEKRLDAEVREYLTKNLGVPNITAFQKMRKEERNHILVSLKKMKGVTIRQLSRVTGISKSVIDRVR